MTFDRFEVVASDGSCEGGLNSMDMDAVRP